MGQRNHEPTQIQEAGTWALPINEGKGMLKNLWTQKKKKKRKKTPQLECTEKGEKTEQLRTPIFTIFKEESIKDNCIHIFVPKLGTNT